jgi:hypothetical protein
MSFSGKSQSATPSPLVRFFFGRIFPIPFILAGGAVLAFGVRNLVRAENSTGWPTAEGIVVESRVASSSGSKGGTTYRAAVRYEYTVSGVKHSGDDIGFGDYGSSNSDHAQQGVNRHPVGQRTKVHYMPEDPSVAVLEPGIQGQAWFMPAFGAVFLTVGLAIAVFLPRSMRKQAEQAAQKAELANSAQSLADLAVPSSHPKVTITKGIDATVFETRGKNLFGVILIFIAVAQIIFFTTVFSKQSGFAFPLPLFLVADSLMLAGGAFIFFSRYTVTVSSGKITLCFGVAGKGYRKEIARLSPMSVTLEHRGSKVNKRPVDSIVVRNADGAEFHFGPFLDDGRKNFLAAHLARLLEPKTTTPANPFA